MYVVRIDGDELRSSIPEYTGSNSHLFQGAISVMVEKIHDFVLRQKQSFVLDGTLAQYGKAVHNIQRSLDKNRPVSIFYIYQKPEIAWKFTQERESLEGRNIPKSAFIEQFLAARDTINKISDEFKDKVVIFFVKKDYEKNTVEKMVKIYPWGRRVDDHIEGYYNKDILEKLL